jgi:hypothetical protein
MKTFKKYISKKEKRSGLVPASIHFKNIEDMLESAGIMPAEVHFKNILSNKKKKLDEAKSSDGLQSWITDREDNKHISKKRDSNAHHEEIAEKLNSTNNFSTEHLKHIRKYTGDPDKNGESVSQKLNKSLIKNKGEPSKAHEKTTNVLSHAIKNNRLPHEVHVYSGTSFDPRKHMDNKNRLKSHAFISATHDKGVAAIFAHKGAKRSYAPAHIMKIHLKPGDPATHVSRHAHFDGEHETIIDRNTTLKHEKMESHWSPNQERWYHIHHMSVHSED